MGTNIGLFFLSRYRTYNQLSFKELNDNILRDFENILGKRFVLNFSFAMINLTVFKVIYV